MTSKNKVLPTGHSMEEIEGEERDALVKNYFCYTDGVMRVNPGRWILPKNFEKTSRLVHDFKYCSTDVIVMPFPKSGTTWTQEIIWNLFHNPELDNPQASVSLDGRFPNFEADMYLETTGAEKPPADCEPVKMLMQLMPGTDISGLLIKLASFSPAPRLIKAHLPICFFPRDILEKCKVVYVAREIRDVVYSLYHYMRLQILWGFRGTLDEFVEDFVNDRMIYGPYFQHLKEAWDRRFHPNFLFVFYEDMKHDIEKEVRRIDKFLGTNRTDKQIQNVIDFTGFSAMKERAKDNQPTSNAGQYYNKGVEEKEGGFFRKGIIGDWKNQFTPAQVRKLNDWAERNLKIFGPDFKYNKIDSQN